MNKVSKLMFACGLLGSVLYPVFGFGQTRNSATEGAANASTISVERAKAVASQNEKPNERLIAAESAVHSTGVVTIKGKTVPYKVSAAPSQSGIKMAR